MMSFGWIPSLGMYLLGIALIGVTFKRHLQKTSPSTKDKINNLLKQEHEAQFIRSISLPDEFFIQVDTSLYPKVDQNDCHKVYQKLIQSVNRKMVNLQGKTNLELKKSYGPQTLDLVGEYERNYFEFMDISIQYGQILYENHFLAEARQALEACILYHCDVSKCYGLLITIYKEQSDLVALQALRPTIEREMQHSPYLHKVLEML